MTLFVNHFSLTTGILLLVDQNRIEDVVLEKGTRNWKKKGGGHVGAAT
jgi:hypothetical protein